MMIDSLRDTCHARITRLGRFAAVSAVIAVCINGCADAPRQTTVDTQKIDRYRKAWVLDAVPDNPRDVGELRTAIVAARDVINDDAPTDPAQDNDASTDSLPATAGDEHGGIGHVAVTGIIGGATYLATNQDYPWEPGKGAFMIADRSLANEEHSHGSNDSHCHFCAKRAQDGSALIRFSSGDQLVPIDARDLFDVTVGQVVTVQGRAHLDENLDLLIIEADGIYVTR